SKTLIRLPTASVIPFCILINWFILSSPFLYLNFLTNLDLIDILVLYVLGIYHLARLSCPYRIGVQWLDLSLFYPLLVSSVSGILKINSIQNFFSFDLYLLASRFITNRLFYFQSKKVPSLIASTIPCMV